MLTYWHPAGQSENIRMYDHRNPVHKSGCDWLLHIFCFRGLRRTIRAFVIVPVSPSRTALQFPAENKIRVLETELSRAAAERDLLRKVALSAEARQRSGEDRAAELEGKSDVRIVCRFVSLASI